MSALRFHQKGNGVSELYSAIQLILSQSPEAIASYISTATKASGHPTWKCILVSLKEIQKQSNAVQKIKQGKVKKSPIMTDKALYADFQGGVPMSIVRAPTVQGTRNVPLMHYSDKEARGNSQFSGSSFQSRVAKPIAIEPQAKQNSQSRASSRASNQDEYSPTAGERLPAAAHAAQLYEQEYL